MVKPCFTSSDLWRCKGWKITDNIWDGHSASSSHVFPPRWPRCSVLSMWVPDVQAIKKPCQTCQSDFPTREMTVLALLISSVLFLLQSLFTKSPRTATEDVKCQPELYESALKFRHCDNLSTKSDQKFFKTKHPQQTLLFPKSNRHLVKWCRAHRTARSPLERRAPLAIQLKTISAGLGIPHVSE
jgi:hypothetical protein